MTFSSSEGRSGADQTGSGSYVLVLRLTNRKQINIGRLGNFSLRPGYYVYVGSAFGPGGLSARLHHHLRPVRRGHWHVDHLRKVAQVEQIWYAEQETRREHEWAALLEAMPGMSIAILGFGSSDCRCQGHLFYASAKPDSDVFARLIRTRFPNDRPLRTRRLPLSTAEPE